MSLMGLKVHVELRVCCCSSHSYNYRGQNAQHHCCDHSRNLNKKTVLAEMRTHVHNYAVLGYLASKPETQDNPGRTAQSEVCLKPPWFPNNRGFGITDLRPGYEFLVKNPQGGTLDNTLGYVESLSLGGFGIPGAYGIKPPALDVSYAAVR